MIELKQKRSLNAKHFAKDNGEFVMDAHVGHIHYFDKLDSKRFREIDWTLKFDEARRGWYFNYHSFRPFLPEYADGWVEFRDLFDDKDQTIRYKAKASHIKGRLVQPKEIGLEKETGVNCVIYDDAFGKGHDYILYFTRSTLKKVVRIREEFKGKEELRFTWDIDFGKRKVYRANRKEDVEVELQKRVAVATKMAYTFDKTRTKTFDSAKQTLIGDSKLDGKEWFTYLRSFKCWDSGEERQTETVKVDYDATNKTITKIITADFLAKSVGDVFTDTTTSYSVSEDSRVQSNHPDTNYGDDVTITAGYRPGYWTLEGYLSADLSSLAGKAITSASLFVYAYLISEWTTKDVYAKRVTASWSESTVTWNNKPGTSDTDMVTHANVLSTDTGWHEYDILNIAQDWADGTYTNYGIHISTEHTGSGSNNEQIIYHSSEYTDDTSLDPYFSITYTEGSSTPADDAVFFGMNF